MARQSHEQNCTPSADFKKLDFDRLNSSLGNLHSAWESSSLHCSDNEISSFDNIDAIESIIFPSDLELTAKPSPILGTEDPNIPPSNVPCVGCGALLQCQHNTFPGFMPSEYFKNLSVKEMKISICQRCYYIRHCGAFMEVSSEPEEYKTIISKIRPTRSVVILVVDVMDMKGSIVPNLMDYVGKNHPLVVIGNKADLLSPDSPEYLIHIKEQLKLACYEAGLSNIHNVSLTSAKTGFGIERLISILFSFYKRRVDMYIVGSANAGKSSLFNALLASDFCKSSARNLIERATVSVWPGTTLNLLKFPIMRPSHRVFALRQIRLSQEQAQKKMEKKLERSKKANKNYTSWELQEDVHLTDVRKDYTRDLDEKGAAWGQKISGYRSRGDGSLVHESRPPAPETYDADEYGQSYWVFDTPGVINSDQILHLLTPKEMTYLTPTTMLVPRCLKLKPQETLFVSGLCRVDCRKSDGDLILSVHSGPNIPIHVVPTFEADEFYQRYIGTEILGVPIGDSKRLSEVPSMVAKEFTVVGENDQTAAADIQLSSVGWISLALRKEQSALLQVYTPGRKGMHLRQPALMPHYMQFKGKRIKGTAFYRTKPPGWVMSKAKRGLTY
ncbi:nitric oxide associated 1 [Plakobranchus ocellatus]|uniref:Nitric oxide associated 1 n=1 Tax=Plakobranchus ocellatus TaxID=259542 RepID=A0AAV4DDU2_9GAST|nr:nitric oxide associated 1 [Plakobranchus ocellatus]